MTPEDILAICVNSEGEKEVLVKWQGLRNVRTPNDGNTEFISNFTPGYIVTIYANVYVNRKVRSGTGKACGQGVREGLCN